MFHGVPLRDVPDPPKWASWGTALPAESTRLSTRPPAAHPVLALAPPAFAGPGPPPVRRAGAHVADARRADRAHRSGARGQCAAADAEADAEARTCRAYVVAYCGINSSMRAT